MISEIELEERLEQARGNPEADQQFFTYLLEATVYAHVPISDDSPKLRFVQFRHPDGFDALPFFTSESRAALHLDGHRLVRGVVHDGQGLEHPSVCRPIEHEVHP